MLNALADVPPRTDCWLMFKVATIERLAQLQAGLLYMNSLEYFSNLAGEESLPLRRDELESVYGVLRAGPCAEGEARFLMQIGEAGKVFDLGPNAVLTATFPRPKNYMLFCMSTLTDGPDGLIPGEIDGQLHFDRRLLEFGSHILLIRNAPVFGDRISRAIRQTTGLFSSNFMHGGFGLVNYRPLEKLSGPKGLFTKDIRFAWQREYRLTFGVEDKLLNEHGAYEFNIGDISDISQIVSIQSLLDEPIRIKRRLVKIVDGVAQPLGVQNTSV